MSENRIIADRRTFLEQLGVGLLGVVAIARRPLLVTPWGTDTAEPPIHRLIDPTQPYAYTVGHGDWWVRWTVPRTPDGTAAFVPGVMRAALTLNGPLGYYVRHMTKPVVILRHAPGYVGIGRKGQEHPYLQLTIASMGCTLQYDSPVPMHDLVSFSVNIDEDRYGTARESASVTYMDSEAESRKRFGGVEYYWTTAS